MRQTTIGKALTIIGTLFFLVSTVTLVSDLFINPENPTGWGEVLSRQTVGQLATPIVVLFVFLGFTGWYLLHPPKIDFRRRFQPWSWIAYFLLALFLFVAAFTSWETNPTGAVFIDPAVRTTFIIIFLGSLMIEFVVMKHIRRRPWLRMLAAAGDAEPRDEREQYLLYQSTSYTFGMGIFTLFILMALFLIAPSPSQSAVFNVFLGYLLVQMGLRSFFFWLFSARGSKE